MLNRLINVLHYNTGKYQFKILENLKKKKIHVKKDRYTENLAIRI